MTINKRITLIKYLNQTSQTIVSFPQISAVCTLQGDTFISWNKEEYELIGADFVNFEYGKSYLIFTQNNANFNLDIGDQNSLNNVNITSLKQIDLYKGSNISVIDKESIKVVYAEVTSGSWNNSLLKWSREEYDIIGADFENFEDGKVYFIISSVVPYSLWPNEPLDPNVYLLKTEADEFITTEDGYILTTG
jgi:hypothetical protein